MPVWTDNIFPLAPKLDYSNTVPPKTDHGSTSLNDNSAIRLSKDICQRCNVLPQSEPQVLAVVLAMEECLARSPILEKLCSLHAKIALASDIAVADLTEDAHLKPIKTRFASDIAVSDLTEETFSKPGRSKFVSDIAVADLTEDAPVARNKSALKPVTWSTPEREVKPSASLPSPPSSSLPSPQKAPPIPALPHSVLVGDVHDCGDMETQSELAMTPPLRHACVAGDDDSDTITQTSLPLGRFVGTNTLDLEFDNSRATWAYITGHANMDQLAEKACSSKNSSDYIMEKAATLKTMVRKSLSAPPKFQRKDHKTNRLREMVHGWNFESVSALLVVSYTVYIGVYADFAVNNELNRLRGEIYQERWWIFQQLFNLAFFFELLTRLAAERLDFFFGQYAGWNFLDMVTVLLPFWDLVEGGSYDHVSSLCYLRIMRIFRIMVSYEFFRIPVFAQLRILITALLLSIPTFCWAVVIAMLFIYSFGVAFVLGFAWRLQGLPYSMDDDLLSYADTITFFGGVGPATLHLLMALMNGVDWIVVYASLDNLHFLYKFGFLIYVIVMFIAVLNIVGGMFIARAFDVVHRDSDWLWFEEQVQKRVFEDRVHALFLDVRKGMSGTISWTEFQSVLADPQVESFLTFMELDVESVREIFTIVQSRDDSAMEVSDLIEGLYRLKGSAKKSQVRLVQEQLRVLRDGRRMSRRSSARTSSSETETNCLPTHRDPSARDR